MANSKYEYVRDFESATNPLLLPGCFVVVRVDGHGFSRLTRAYNFMKPNDKRCNDLLVRAAQVVMQRFSPDIALSYGQSDEFSFIFRKGSKLFNRRANKLTSLIPAVFSSAFTRLWPNFFPDEILRHDVGFDARTILFPNTDLIRDYLRWRQVDCHINNLYNSTFHALTGDFVSHSVCEDKVTVQPLPVYSDPSFKALSPQQATRRLSGSVSSHKHEILFSEFGINYNNELEQFKKGSVIILSEDQVNKNKIDAENRNKVVADESYWSSDDPQTLVLHVDIIKDDFWKKYQYLADYLET